MTNPSSGWHAALCQQPHARRSFLERGVTRIGFGPATPRA
ncbi:hypothetical protein BN440_0764 [Erwinia amylovora MR1]|nr:hypothetical protein BN440_0764 [Erwinia amylovora MR1]